jgi:hypothetical protein
MKNDTRFMRQLHLLTKDQLYELSQAMTEASLAHELGGDWRQIFKNKTYKYSFGYVSRVYNMLSKMHNTKIDNLAMAMSK